MFLSILADVAPAVPVDDLAKLVADLINDLGTKSYIAAAVAGVALVLALLKKFNVLGAKPAPLPVPPPPVDTKQALKLLGKDEPVPPAHSNPEG